VSAPTPRDPLWAASAASVLAQLGVDPDRGLPARAVVERLARHGANRLPEPKPAPALTILLRQFRGLVNLLLAAAALAALAFGEFAEVAAIGAVIVLNAAIGFVTELRAVRSLESLRQLGRTTTRVRRDGHLREVAAEDLVPGDVVLLEAGDVVPADLRVLRASRLAANESQLTGESLPVDKSSAPVPVATPLPERSCLLFRGSSIVRGSGEGVVAGTGSQTELARIAILAAGAQATATPLERKLQQLARVLAGAALTVGALTALVGMLAGHGLYLMIETGIALAVAATPEALPIVATLTLARGVWRMARRQALVSRLSAVETLGTVTVICTDKTGTLTENRLTVVGIVVDGDTVGIACDNPLVRRALRIGALCSNASLGPRGDSTGDPLEIALLAAAAAAGCERERLLRELPEVREEAFDATQKMMATIHRDPGGEFWVALKGAPEVVLAACAKVGTRDGDLPLSPLRRQHWVERQQALASSGYRVLALAEKRAPSAACDPYAGLTWIGLALLEDPPRADVGAAIAACRAAGVRVVMVTGDQAGTARTIAREVGLLARDDPHPAIPGTDIADAAANAETRQNLLAGHLFARVDPAQKLNLVRLYQEAGEIVAMTGDGVNDAPALRQADVGIAMGRRGSQVAREAADVILEDDSFATIAVAIRQGRVILDNIRRFMVYLFSCNAAEVLTVGVATVLGAPLPLLPLQLLFLNLVTDVFPALALGLGDGTDNVMARPPRDPREPLLTRAHWLAITVHAGTMAATVLAAMSWGLHRGLADERVVTMSFLTLAIAQLWHVFNMRAARSHTLANEVTSNPYLWGALALCAGLLLAAVTVPALSGALRLVSLTSVEWRMVALFSVLPLVVTELARRGALLSHGARRA
jgi:P-type Ca2+ transporter type 2C